MMDIQQHPMHAKRVVSAAVFISKRPPDARAYLSIVDCPAFLQAVADGNAAAVEEFHNDGVGILHKVNYCRDSQRVSLNVHRALQVIPNCFGEACIDAWGDGPVRDECSRSALTNCEICVAGTLGRSKQTS